MQLMLPYFRFVCLLLSSSLRSRHYLATDEILLYEYPSSLSSLMNNAEQITNPDAAPAGFVSSNPAPVRFTKPESGTTLTSSENVGQGRVSGSRGQGHTSISKYSHGWAALKGYLGFGSVLSLRATNY